jgi:hypothetical protein
MAREKLPDQSERVMAQHSSGCTRIGGDFLQVLSMLVTVDDAPGEAQRSAAIPRAAIPRPGFSWSAASVA